MSPAKVWTKENGSNVELERKGIAVASLSIQINLLHTTRAPDYRNLSIYIMNLITVVPPEAVCAHNYFQQLLPV